MIRTPTDAKFELQVVEREERFIDGFQWHLKDMLRKLQHEERILMSKVKDGSQHLSQNRIDLLAMDPLADASSPSRIQNTSSSEEEEDVASVG